VLALQHRLDLEAARQFYRFTGCAGGCNDYDATGRGFGSEVGVSVGGKVVVADVPGHGKS